MFWKKKKVVKRASALDQRMIRLELEELYRKRASVIAALDEIGFTNKDAIFAPRIWLPDPCTTMQITSECEIEGVKKKVKKTIPASAFLDILMERYKDLCRQIDRYELVKHEAAS